MQLGGAPPPRSLPQPNPWAGQPCRRSVTPDPLTHLMSCPKLMPGTMAGTAVAVTVMGPSCALAAASSTLPPSCAASLAAAAAPRPRPPPSPRPVDKGEGPSRPRPRPAGPKPRAASDAASAAAGGGGTRVAVSGGLAGMATLSTHTWWSRAVSHGFFEVKCCKLEPSALCPLSARACR